MMPETKELLSQFDPSAQKPHEPDYIFVVNSRRAEVLYDQFKSLNGDDDDEDNGDDNGEGDNAGSSPSINMMKKNEKNLKKKKK